MDDTSYAQGAADALLMLFNLCESLGIDDVGAADLVIGFGSTVHKMNDRGDTKNILNRAMSATLREFVKDTPRRRSPPSVKPGREDLACELLLRSVVAMAGGDIGLQHCDRVLSLLLEYRQLNFPDSSSKKPIPGRLRLEVLERDAYRCQICNGWADLTVDHIYPESRGGPATLENLRTLCRSCNSSKGDRV